MSELRADTITGSDGTSPVTLTKQSAAKVWANINQSGNSVRGSSGLSSMTDNAGGDVSINFTNAFDSTNNYAVNGTTGSNASSPDSYVTGPDGDRTHSTTTVGLNLMNFNGSLNDQSVLWITAHGDLA
jgi:hypothetical protein